MRISKFGNLYQLTLLPRLFPVNCYLYEEENELILIDAGMPASFKGIVHLIERINKPLTNIILTHAHGDHVGSVDQLKQRFPNVIVSISVRDNRLLLGDQSLGDEEPKLPIKGGFDKNLKTIPDLLLNEGDRIGSFEVISTPGHTPGSISLFNTINKQLIVGDAMQTKGKVAVVGQLVPTFPFPTFGTWNKKLALESVKKILQLEPSLVAVGHGKVLENPMDILKQAIHEAEKKLVTV
ncbi:MBL fold metallo-hydrolase [Ureibacillus acetophenoni]|uniref:Glyoxylase-like metal-dependent hydrolase (Beta-lactamase superfamily II) n=1 Tax=Ureibacillus acetophenoni TaxID=614649 RepID=A0A285UH97_9BACL|nr:MBL fold metallo-hydrolase [Ureibacillus acetophenoni]SOC40768.1 glyoxylase-like metal-dependent hydrolase (beta-lactamase superfamily II) [Ureibacillus acetophenoni]